MKDMLQVELFIIDFSQFCYIQGVSLCAIPVYIIPVRYWWYQIQISETFAYLELHHKRLAAL